MATVSKRRKKAAAKSSSKPSKSASRNGQAHSKSAKSSGRKSVGKMIYHFSKSRTDGNGTMKPLLGGKGANLAAMTSIGLPVPARLHHHHRSLHVLLQERQKVSAVAC